MKIRTLGSTIDASNYNCAATYLVNDSIAIDAGTLGLAALPTQQAVHSVFLSHCHLDHTGSLPLFVDNVYKPGPECVRIFAGDATIEGLKKSLFNDVVWPDVIRLSQEESPFVEFQTLADEQTVEVDGISITPVALNHVVPTFGFIIDDGESAVAIVSDTSPTERVWELLHEHPRIKAIFLECAFPDSMLWLAEKAFHLTPSLFKAELAKLDREIPIVAIHVKPAFHEEVWAELKHVPRVIPSSPNHEFTF